MKRVLANSFNTTLIAILIIIGGTTVASWLTSIGLFLPFGLIGYALLITFILVMLFHHKQNKEIK